MAVKTVTVIGSGNVGYQLAVALHQKGFAIRQVFSRDISKATTTAKAVNAIAVNAWDAIDALSDVYICCLSDNALTEAANNLKLTNKVVLHTAGSVSMDVLQPIAQHIGVLYPLQSISRNRQPDWANIPLLVESSDAVASEIINRMANALSKNVHAVTIDQRRAAHLAAVFANNFPNHLWTIAEKLCEENDVSFEWLKPLINETVIKALKLSPADAQTGPAMRNDTETMELHNTLLAEHPLWQKIYNDISESIKSN